MFLEYYNNNKFDILCYENGVLSEIDSWCRLLKGLSYEYSVSIETDIVYYSNVYCKMCTCFYIQAIVPRSYFGQ